MDNETTAFVFQRSYYEAAKGMDPAARLAYLDSVIKYALYGEAPADLDAIGAAVFTAIRPAIDSSLERYQQAKLNGSRGGRPRRAKNQE